MISMGVGHDSSGISNPSSVMAIVPLLDAITMRFTFAATAASHNSRVPSTWMACISRGFSRSRDLAREVVDL